MKSNAKKNRIPIALITLFIFIVAVLSTRAQASVISPDPTTPVVVRVYYTIRENLDTLANTLDIWQVNHEQGYLVALVSPQQYQALSLAGYRLEIDPVRTAELNQPPQPLPGQRPDTIPGYPCYRTVEETYAAMSTLAANNPSLATWLDIGDSWEKVKTSGLAGYNLNALDLTSKIRPGPKPIFFVMAEIHAREYVTAETATRFSEYLVANYGVDPDVTWLLDYYHVYIVPMTNPDGRKIAEGGVYWRKNIDNDDSCTDPYTWGTDLNRNHSFKWNMGGSSGYPCDETYHGPTASSEPETNAIQNFLLTLFPDQRGPLDTDPAPLTATGTFITLHSAAGLVLWPWGWTYTSAPNNTQLQTLGRKLAYFNDYTPEQSTNLYPTSGTSDDWAYGNLGIASYTIEMGTDFFQDCASFENTIYPDNRNALIYAFKAARHPYMDPSGPDTVNITATPACILPGTRVSLEGTADDTRYSSGSGEPTQNIAAAHFTLDDPSWITGTVTYPMVAKDGNFNSKSEVVSASVDTGYLAPGRHTLFVESKDATNNWGVPGSVFLSVGAAYGVSISPTKVAQNTLPGQIVTYTLNVYNLDTATDTYTVSLTSGWPASAPLQITNIPGCGGEAFNVTVDVPGTAAFGTSDTATLVVTSHANPAHSASASLTTEVVGNPPEVLPLATARAGVPGQIVTYTLSVTNTNPITDTFDVTTTSKWPLMTLPTLGPLPPDGNTSLTVTVTVPLTVQAGEKDVASLVIASQNPGVGSVTVTLTTTANAVYGLAVFIPVDEQEAMPGNPVTYTLHITNTGNTTDTFHVVVNSLWEVSAENSTGPLESGDSTDLTVVVIVPILPPEIASDTATVTITSQGDPEKLQQVFLVTHTRWQGVWIPVIFTKLFASQQF